MFLFKLFKRKTTKLLTLFGSLAMALGVGAATSYVASEQQNEVVETKADYSGLNDSTHRTYWDSGWDWMQWCNVCLNKNGAGALTLDTTHTTEVYIPNYECAVNDEFYGHTGLWDDGWGDPDWNHYDKGLTNNATGSSWDKTGNNGNVKCKTAGVYNLTYKPQDRTGTSSGDSSGIIYVSWGTVTVNLYYVDSSGNTVKTQSSTTTTSQNNFDAPTIPNVEGYTKPTVWKIGSRTGSDYSAQKITVATYNLYAVYTAAPVSYTVILASTPAGYGSVSPTSVTVPAGTSYSASTNKLTIGDTVITATPAGNTAQYSYSFASWSSTSGTISGNVTITATFARSTRSYTVTIGKNNPSYGTVSASSVASVPYNTTYSTSGNKLTINTATPTVITATPAASTSEYTFAFSGWSSASGTITGATTITANFTRTGVAYNLTYQYKDIDGTTIKASDVASTPYNTAKTLPTPSVDGYRHVQWYESSDFSGTARAIGYAFNMPAANKTFTAKMERIGFYLVGLGDWSTATSRYSEGESGGNIASWTNWPVAKDQTFKIKYLNAAGSESDGYWGYSRVLSSSTAYAELSADGDDNIVIGADGVIDVYFTRWEGDDNNMLIVNWHPNSDYANKYYVVGDAKFTKGGEEWSVSTGRQLSGTPTGTDKAAGLHIEVPADSTFCAMQYINGHHDNWFNSFGDYPDSCEVVGANLHYKGEDTAHFDFYINSEGVIYIVDDSVIDDAGYLYYASNSAKSAITLVASNGDPTPTINGYLSNVTNVVEGPSTLVFDGKAHVYKIPVYNLRGTSLTKKITSITIAGATINMSSLAQNDKKEFYINGTNLQEKGAQAVVIAWNLAESIGGATNQSLCALDKGTLTTFESNYTALTDTTAKTLLNNATINTYTPTGNSYDAESGPAIKTKTNVSIQEIYNYVNTHYNAESETWTLGVFGPAANPESSPLTTTLWIVLASGLAGLAAIGTAYFVSKKKRHQA